MMNPEFFPCEFIIRDDLYAGVSITSDGVFSDRILNILIRMGKQPDLYSVILTVYDCVMFHDYIRPHILAVGSYIYIYPIIPIIYDGVVTRISAAGTFKAYRIEVVHEMVVLNRNLGIDIQRVVAVYHMKATDLYPIRMNFKKHFVIGINYRRRNFCGIPL